MRFSFQSVFCKEFNIKFTLIKNTIHLDDDNIKRFNLIL